MMTFGVSRNSDLAEPSLLFRTDGEESRDHTWFACPLGQLFLLALAMAMVLLLVSMQLPYTTHPT